MSTAEPPGPTPGPCTPWITADDVPNCCTIQADADALAVVAEEASVALFEISGRQFTGLCTNVVRPCRQMCDCWGGIAAGLPWYWGAGSSWPAAWAGWGGAWGNECGERCGCGQLSTVLLSGYPVREIVEVLIDGQTVDPDGYRLDGWNTLVRMADPGPPVVDQSWPACQNLALNADQPGTFQITYRYGIDVPALGRRAACQLACQLLAACPGTPAQASGTLPQGVVSIDRQGVKVERSLLANWFDPKKPTGLTAVDMFLRAHWAGRQQRRSAIFSPDIARFARQVGS